MHHVAQHASKKNRLDALNMLTEYLDACEIPDAIPAAIAVLKRGRRASYTEDALIDYIGKGVRPTHLPALRALEKVRKIKDLDQVIAWATKRPKTFDWEFYPSSDDDE